LFLLDQSRQRIFSAVKSLGRPNHYVRKYVAQSQARCHNSLYFKGLTASVVIPFSAPSLDTQHKSAIRNKYLTHEGRIPDAILIAG
jgi:hypothetical protein